MAFWDYRDWAYREYIIFNAYVVIWNVGKSIVILDV